MPRQVEDSEPTKESVGEVFDTKSEVKDFEVCTSESSNSDKEWKISLKTSGSLVTFKLDTGSQVNILPESVHKALMEKPKIHKANVNLTAYNGGNNPVKGKCVARINVKNKTYPAQFIIVPTDSYPIIGLKTCEQLNLIKRVISITDVVPDFTEEYQDVFGDIGCLHGEYHIKVDPSIPPVVHPPRRVPFALKDKLRAELERMERLEIIEKVNRPTDWVNSIVIVEKPSGDLRICLDPRDLTTTYS
jgi:hypothetical protein